MEYSSDSENKDDLENGLFMDSEFSHKYHMDFGSDGRQVMERLINTRMKSTENILYTSQKQNKFLRTPENSAKKTKLLRLNYTFLSTLFQFFFKNPNTKNVNLKMITYLLGKEN